MDNKKQTNRFDLFHTALFFFSKKANTFFSKNVTGMFNKKANTNPIRNGESMSRTAERIFIDEEKLKNSTIRATVYAMKNISPFFEKFIRLSVLNELLFFSLFTLTPPIR